MPNETEGPNLAPDDDEIDRMRLLWRDESYLRELSEREAQADIDASLETTEKMLAMSRELQEARRAEERPTTDFQAIFEKNVSLAKQAPVKRLKEDWAKREAEAQRDAEQGFTTLGNARENQFGGKKPVVYEGEIVEVLDPNQKEDLKEVRKGTPSRHVHKPRASRTNKLQKTAKPGRAGDKNAPQHITEIDGERIIR